MLANTDHIPDGAVVIQRIVGLGHCKEYVNMLKRLQCILLVLDMSLLHLKYSGYVLSTAISFMVQPYLGLFQN